MASEDEKKLFCAVCSELYDDPRILPCEDSYCLKCLPTLAKKTSNQNVITCIICQRESICEYDGQIIYPTNNELTILVQSYISETRTDDTLCLCDICDGDTKTMAQRACVDCDVMYCEGCFKNYHPMKGKLGKHKIVKATENSKYQKDMKNCNRDMYCDDCDSLLSGSDISDHNKHEVVPLDKARLIFKNKLQEATSDIYTIQALLNSCLSKSEEKLKLVASVFDEIKVEVDRKREDVLSKLIADTNEAHAIINSQLPAISTYVELLKRAGTISFIEECQMALKKSSLKQILYGVRMFVDSIDALKCSNETILSKINELEVCIYIATDGPKITKSSHVIKEKRRNKVLLEWTTVQNAESYNVMAKVKESTSQVASTIGTSCELYDIDGSETTALWVTAVVHGREGSPSAHVVVPTVTLLNLQFDRQRAGVQVRVSEDGKKISQTDFVHHPESGKEQRYRNTILGNLMLVSGSLYWKVEAEHKPGGCCRFLFGVTSSLTPGDCNPVTEALAWTVQLDCEKTQMTIKMLNAGHCLHKEDYIITSSEYTHQYGLLLNTEKCSLSVIDANDSNIIFTFMNVDASRGITPVFAALNRDGTLRLLEPEEIGHAPVLPFSIQM